MHICICIEMSHNAYTDGCGVRIVAHFSTNAYMHEQSTMGFGVRIVAGNTLTSVRLLYLTASELVSKHVLYGIIF